MRNSAQKILHKYLEENYLKEDRIRRLISCANYDLYFGPYGEYEPDNDGFIYPGFAKACSEIQSALQDLPFQLWVDADSEEVFQREPEGFIDEETGEYIEPILENTWHFDSKDIKRALLGKELASTI